MADPFVAEIRIFGFNFAPKGWATCDGQLMPLSQNTALFSLLGTMYGGDGKSNFALPNLQGSAPMNQGQGPGLSARYVGDSGGNPTVNLRLEEIPGHNHNLMTVNDFGDINTPGGMSMARSSGTAVYNTATSPLAAMSPTVLGNTGNNQPHNNLQPYLTLLFCIALQGVYPPRS